MAFDLPSLIGAGWNIATGIFGTKMAEEKAPKFQRIPVLSGVNYGRMAGEQRRQGTFAEQVSEGRRPGGPAVFNLGQTRGERVFEQGLPEEYQGTFPAVADPRTLGRLAAMTAGEQLRTSTEAYERTLGQLGRAGEGLERDTSAIERMAGQDMRAMLASADEQYGEAIRSLDGAKSEARKLGGVASRAIQSGLEDIKTFFKGVLGVAKDQIGKMTDFTALRLDESRQAIESQTQENAFNVVNALADMGATPEEQEMGRVWAASAGARSLKSLHNGLAASMGELMQQNTLGVLSMVTSTAVPLVQEAERLRTVGIETQAELAARMESIGRAEAAVRSDWNNARAQARLTRQGLRTWAASQRFAGRTNLATLYSGLIEPTINYAGIAMTLNSYIQGEAAGVTAANNQVEAARAQYDLAALQPLIAGLTSAGQLLAMPKPPSGGGTSSGDQWGIAGMQTGVGLGGTLGAAAILD